MKPLADIAYSRLNGKVPTTFYVGSSAPTSVEETGDSFVALKDGQSFGRNDMYGTAERRYLFVNIYCAPSPGMDDAEQKALALFEQIDPLLDRQNQHTWPDIVTCERESVDIIPVPDSDSLLYSCRYSIRTWN